MPEEPNEEERLLGEIIRKEFPDIDSWVFKPYVLYNERMDWIEVLTADCSVCERLVTDMLHLHERNHREDGESKYVGFHMECARRFCRAYGLPDKGKVKVSDILMRLSAVDGTTARAVQNIALPILREHGLDEVEFPAN